MKINNKKRGIINKHLLTSILLFLVVLIVVLTFISFLEDAQKKDKSLLSKKEKILNKKNN
jgi:hypothetical protein